MGVTMSFPDPPETHPIPPHLPLTGSIERQAEAVRLGIDEECRKSAHDALDVILALYAEAFEAWRKEWKRANEAEAALTALRQRQNARCHWCGQLNAWWLMRCEHCGKYAL